MSRIPIARRVFATLLLLACAGDAPPQEPPRLEPTVILISLDGTRPADAADPELRSLARLLRAGARAERLVPVFPTNTFPNHVTLVTGVGPAVHGVVNNVFVDPARGLHDYSGDPSWIEVEPLWSWCAAHGVVSASFHWVGSEGPWTSGRGPREWRRFERGIRESEKVEQILAWLDTPDPARRPRLVTAWFRGADHAGHEHGPGTPAVRRALRSQDAALGALLEGLVARDALEAVTLLLVSDHGMAAVERHVDLRAALRDAGVAARVLGGGGFVTLLAQGQALHRAVEVARGLGLEAWPRPAAPAELGVGHPRFGDAVVLAPPGTAVGRSRPAGGHGYRPEEGEMGALLLAVGRGVEPGSELGPQRALDVAPTVLALLGLPRPDWMQGRPIRALLPADVTLGP